MKFQSTLPMLAILMVSVNCTSCSKDDGSSEPVEENYGIYTNRTEFAPPPECSPELNIDPDGTPVGRYSVCQSGCQRNADCTEFPGGICLKTRFVDNDWVDELNDDADIWECGCSYRGCVTHADCPGEFSLCRCDGPRGFHQCVSGECFIGDDCETGICLSFGDYAGRCATLRGECRSGEDCIRLYDNPDRNWPYVQGCYYNFDDQYFECICEFDGGTDDDSDFTAPCSNPGR